MVQAQQDWMLLTVRKWIAEGSIIGDYEFSKYKSKKENGNGEDNDKQPSSFWR